MLGAPSFNFAWDAQAGSLNSFVPIGGGQAVLALEVQRVLVLYGVSVQAEFGPSSLSHPKKIGLAPPEDSLYPKLQALHVGSGGTADAVGDAVGLSVGRGVYAGGEAVVLAVGLGVTSHSLQLL